MARCRARMHYGDDTSVTCNQDATLGSDYCYLHRQYERGLCAPIPSKRPEENITSITDRVSGDALWSEVGDAVEAIAMLVA